LTSVNACRSSIGLEPNHEEGTTNRQLVYLGLQLPEPRWQRPSAVEEFVMLPDSPVHCVAASSLQTTSKLSTCVWKQVMSKGGDCLSTCSIEMFRRTGAVSDQCRPSVVVRSTSLNAGPEPSFASYGAAEILPSQATSQSQPRNHKQSAKMGI